MAADLRAHGGVVIARTLSPDSAGLRGRVDHLRSWTVLLLAREAAVPIAALRAKPDCVSPCMVETRSAMTSALLASIVSCMGFSTVIRLTTNASVLRTLTVLLLLHSAVPRTEALWLAVTFARATHAFVTTTLPVETQDVPRISPSVLDKS